MIYAKRKILCVNNVDEDADEDINVDEHAGEDEDEHADEDINVDEHADDADEDEHADEDIHEDEHAGEDEDEHADENDYGKNNINKFANGAFGVLKSSGPGRCF